MTATEWRGQFDETPDDLRLVDGEPRRGEARALLAALLRPYGLALGVLALVVIVENAARLVVPLLVQRGIDYGIPPLRAGGSAGERPHRLTFPASVWFNAPCARCWRGVPR